MVDELYLLAQAAFLLGVIFAITVAGILFLKRWRGHADKEMSVTSDMTTTFRELHVRGDLNDDEYRTIKTVLEDEYRKDSGDSGRTG